MKVASVIIPAHDEEALIGECLDSVLSDVSTDELEVVVVANGCSDRTAAVARSFSGVVVVEIDEPSKTAALNAGDEVATCWPRVYVDADVIVGSSSLKATLNAVETDGMFAAAPAYRVDTTGRPWAVRAYYEIYRQIPWTQSGMVGSGIYALSQQGRERFGAFPDVTNDDLFVSGLFAPSERITPPEATFTVRAPYDIASLLRCKRRVAAGNLLHRRLAERLENMPASRRHLSPYLQMSKRPSLWPSLVVYASIQIVTRLAARVDVASRDQRVPVWSRDDSIRTRVSR